MTRADFDRNTATGGIALPARLKRDTAELHRASERSTVMADLMAGRIERATYCSLLRNLHLLYQTLENALQHNRNDKHIAPIYMPVLFRTAALASDLEQLHGADWARDLSLQPAAVAYQQRLDLLRTDAPALLVAHAYVRYLGDLHGGQILKRIVAAAWCTADASVTRFYDFGSAADTTALLRQFGNGLQTIPASSDVQDGIVTEAKFAFQAHIDLFGELAARPI
jgi:heme oxygenase (biliverdin-producing, ferredoxin)